MSSRKYWIELPHDVPGRLAILARPLGGDRLAEVVRDWANSGVGVVVSLLTDEEVAELDLREEQAVCNESRIEFRRFPIDDRGVPASHREMHVLVEHLRDQLMKRQTIGIHCRAGIGRSALVAACFLCRMSHNTDSALRLIKRARGVDVPDTVEQREWVRSFTERR